MKLFNKKIPFVFLASTMAVLVLIVFQIIWMQYSKKLSEEIFNQRASMALCSAISSFDGNLSCSGGKCTSTCASDKDANKDSLEIGFTIDYVKSKGFEFELEKALKFYKVDAKYSIDTSTVKEQGKNTFQCAVELPGVDSTNSYLSLSFPEKEAFILKNMKLMFLASIFILLFITIVLIYANWSLLKQKNLLQTNIDFFNNLAHEFRTPLSNIGLATSMLNRKNPDLQNNEYLEVIKNENANLLNEVEKVLHLASMENGDYVLNKEKIHLKSLLQNVIDSFKITIRQNEAVISFENFDDEIEIYGDKKHLSNVFRNIIDNSLKYSIKNPIINISAKYDDNNGVTVSFKDNGIGIPAGKTELIFEKFQRITCGDIQNQKGFGLGLAYVKSMIDLHKGSIGAHSENNNGTQFDIYLPAIS